MKTASYTLFVQRERDYTQCMEPRGYIVTMWKADSKPSSRNKNVDSP